MKITFKTIKNYLQAHYREALEDMDMLQPHIKEQVLQRCVLAKECLIKGKCKICNCTTPDLFYGDEPCHNNPPCYPKMLSKEEWESKKPIIIKPENANMADLMQANPDLSKEELLHWCPEFKEDLPGKGGTQFKIKLSKDSFAGNMTQEQVEDIARDLGFYDSENIESIQIKDVANFIIMDLSKDETLEDLMRNNSHLTKERILELYPKCCPICKGNKCTNDGYSCYFCKPEEFKQQTS